MEELAEEVLAHFGVVGGPEDVHVPCLVDGLGGHASEVADLAEVEEFLVLLNHLVGVVQAPPLLTGQLSLELVLVLSCQCVNLPVGNLLEHNQNSTNIIVGLTTSNDLRKKHQLTSNFKIAQKSVTEGRGKLYCSKMTLFCIWFMSQEMRFDMLWEQEF